MTSNTIAFAPHFLNLISSGRKTVTSRLIKFPVEAKGFLTAEQRDVLLHQCPWAPGQTVGVIVDNQLTDVTLKILDISVKFVSEFTESQARLEGFESCQAFCDELARIYGDSVVTDDRAMWVVSFQTV
jgi:hypothetical protein